MVDTTSNIRVNFIVTGAEKVKKSMDKIAVAGDKMKQRFNYWALSILFFGMAIQRTFVGIARAAVSSFMKIIDSNNMTTASLKQLSGWWEYLKFTVGRAIDETLKPFLPLIIKIVNSFAEWIQKHKEIVTWTIGLGAAIGTLMFTFATFKLGFDGLVIAFGKLKPYLEPILTFFRGLSLLEFGALIALFATLKITWEKDLADIKSTVGQWVMDLKNIFDGMTDGINLTFKSLFDLITALIEGDSEKVKKAMANLGLGLLTIVSAISFGIIKIFSAMILFISKLMLEFITSGLKLFFTSLFEYVINQIKQFKKLAEFLGMTSLQKKFGTAIDSLKDFNTDLNKNLEKIGSDSQDVISGWGDKWSDALTKSNTDVINLYKDASGLSESSASSSKSSKQTITINLQSNTVAYETMMNLIKAYGGVK